LQWPTYSSFTKAVRRVGDSAGGASLTGAATEFFAEFRCCIGDVRVYDSHQDLQQLPAADAIPDLIWPGAAKRKRTTSADSQGGLIVFSCVSRKKI
jgi:hypothetical protein